MTSAKFLRAAIPVALAAAVLAALLPGDAGASYAKASQPGALAVAAVLSVWVSRIYRGQMRTVFLLLGAFLALYGLANVSWLVELAQEAWGRAFLRALLAYQVVAYACLVGAAVLVVRVVDSRRLNTAGRVVTALGAALGAGIVASAWEEYRAISEVSPEGALLYLVIRMLDMTVVALLVPVVWLYVQNARGRYQENGTFMLVAGGIMASLVFAYLYELARGQPLAEIAAREFQRGSALDVLYLAGYLIIVVGLVAHRKHQEWSFSTIESLLRQP